MKAIKLALFGALASVLPMLAAGEAVHRFLMPLSYYYADGTRENATTPVVTPSQESEHMIPFVPGTNYVFTALPTAGHKLDGWRLASQAAIALASDLQSLKPVDEFEGVTVTFRWNSKYGNDSYYYLTPCFSWINWTLAYRSNYVNINGDYGAASYIYTNSVTVADASALWNAKRIGYDIIGWSLASDGDVQYTPGQTIESAGETLGIAAEGDTVYLYAVWQKREMPISLDAQGGNVASNSVIARIDEKYSLPTPTREGYTFDGWFTDATSGTKITSGETDVARDDIDTLYAHWSPIRFSLSYDWNWTGSDGAPPATAQYNYADSVTLGDGPASWKRIGYDFAGWATNDTTVAQFAPGATYNPAGRYLGVSAGNLAIKLFGVWQVRTMSISLEAQDGTVSPGAISARVGEKYSLPTPTREGFTFDGWFTAASGGEQIPDGSVVTRDDITKLYAHWTVITYTLSCSWNCDDAPDNPAPRQLQYTDAVTLVSPAWHRTGYDFLGWSPASDATEATYAAGAELINSGGIFGITDENRKADLYGVWYLKPLKIALDAQGGKVSSSSVTAFYGKNYSLPTPTREGFTFDGWFTAADGGEQVADGSIVTRDDITNLYARWTVITYTLSYSWNCDGAPENPEPFQQDYTNAVTLVSPAWHRTGYDFLGWSPLRNATTAAYDAGEQLKNSGRKFGITEANREAELYGVWNLKPLRIALDAQGGDVSSRVATAFYGKKYSLPTPMRDGFIFEGWFTDPTDGTKVSDGDNVAVDDISTLYAHWRLIKFTLAYDQNLPASAESKWVGEICDWTNTVAISALPADWNRTGWDFLGWARERTCEYYEFPVGLPIDNIGRVFDADEGTTNTLYAVWDIKNMPIALDAQGDMPYVNDYTAVVGDTLAPPPTGIVVTVESKYNLPELVRRDCWFDGWFTTLDGGDLITNGQSVVRADISTLYAHWTPKQTFTVTANFLDSSGQPTNETQTVFEKDSAVLPGLDATDTWVGHTFMRWEPEDASCIKADTKFTANYKTNEYEVVFDSNGGYGRMPPMKLVYGVETNLSLNAFHYGTEDAMIFAGWALDDDLDTIVFADDEAVTDLTAVDGAKVYLNAVWQDNRTDFSIAANSDIVLTPDTNKWVYTDNLDGIVADNESKWYVTNLIEVTSNNVDGVAVFTTNFIPVVATSSETWFSGRMELRGSVNGKGVLSFEWGANNELTPGGITPQEDTCELSIDGEIKLPLQLKCNVWPTSNKLEHVEIVLDSNGWKEIAWSLPWLGENSFYLRNITWVPEGQFTVSFDGNGGEGSMDGVKFYQGEYGTLPKNRFTMAGYTFDGWLYEFEYGGDTHQVTLEDRESTSLLTNDTTLVAQWAANNYWIRFDANGGIGTMPDQELEYDSAEALDAVNFTRTGYTFANWLFNGTEYSDGESVSNLTTEANAILDFAAQWTANLYTAKFEANGGAGDALAPIPCTYDVPWKLPENPFDRVGYEFAGWQLGEDVLLPGDVVSNLTADVDGEVTFTALWTPNEFTVAFDGGEGASGTMFGIPLTYDKSRALPANLFTRSGYSFGGWVYGDETFDDCAVVSNLVADSAGAITLAARWVGHKYTVVFDPNGAEGQMDEQEFVYGTAAALSKCGFERLGYVFAGWSRGDDVVVFADEQEVKDLTAVEGGIIVLYAQWAPITYTVEFDGNGADGQMDAQEFVYDTPARLHTCEFEREGYVFAGWSRDDGAVEFADEEKVVNLTAVDDDIVVLYAQWTPITYTVEFEGNGAQGQMDSQVFVYGTPTPLPKCEFGRLGYIFAGWSLGDDVVVCADEQEVTGLTSAEDGIIVLYAQWAPITYTVEFDGNGAGNAMPSITLAYNEAKTLPANAFKRTGYTFVEWRQGENVYEDGAEVLNLTSRQGESITLVASWRAHQYSIAFVANGGEGEMAGGTFAYGENSELPQNSFTRTGYIFVGWAMSEDGEVVYGDAAEFSNLAAANGANVALYAIWQPISYLVCFDANCGEGEMDDFAMTYDEPANLPSCAFSRTGFRFVAWELDGVEYPDAAEVLNLADVQDAIVVFVARWEEVSTPDPDPEPDPDPDADKEHDDNVPVAISGEVFPSGVNEIGEFTATATSTYNGWLRDKTSNSIAALLSVKTTAAKNAGAVSRVTIKVTPFSGKKTTYKTSVAPGANPVDEFGIVYGALGLSGEFGGYAVEAALDFSKAKSGTAERAIADRLPTGCWTVAFESDEGCASFSATVSKKGKAKVAGFMPNGTKVSVSAQGILGADNVFAIPVMNAKKGVGFVLWVSEKGVVDVTDCTNPSWMTAAKSMRSNLADGKHSLSFAMPKWRTYITATDVGGVNVTPIGEASLSVAGGKWSVAKSAGKVAVVKASSPPQTYVKIKDGLTPVNLAALNLTYTAKSGIAKGSFKLWYLNDGKIRSDKFTVSGAVSEGKFFGVASSRKLGSFKVTSE